ncbi:MAG: alpha-amylase, partial [Cellulomonadaceae bacterium]|nr:alpha-amylase [Cellulomonadaceae bacterium]
CTDDLGPAGYGWVLVSPPQEHVLGSEWWTAYQPVSYEVESRLGTREQFATMVSTCADAGVQVIADAVINHMTGDDDGGTGWAGSTYEHYDYPGLYTDADFHHCGLASGDDIADYGDAEQVQTCELVNLADLATETDHVREQIVGYLEDLLSLGVAGFRFDAAKHMPEADVVAIVDALPEGTRVFQEVIYGGGEPVQPTDYLPSGDLFDFVYSRDLKSIAQSGSVDRALDLGATPGSIPAADAVVFVTNHDTERNGSTLAYDDDAYVLANVLMLAGVGEQGGATPMVYSGYAFSDTDTGPAQDADGAVLDAVCADPTGPGTAFDDGAWVCQHRWAAISGMVGWRIAVGDAAAVDVQTSTKALAMGRGEVGFLAVNGAADPVTQTLTTSLPDGDYCDELTGGVQDGRCVGTPVTVDGGSLTVTIPGRSAVAIDVEATPA